MSTIIYEMKFENLNHRNCRNVLKYSYLRYILFLPGKAYNSYLGVIRFEVYRYELVSLKPIQFDENGKLHKITSICFLALFGRFFEIYFL